MRQLIAARTRDILASHNNGQCGAIASDAWDELISFRPPAALQNTPITGGWHFQPIEDAASARVNLDYYEVSIETLPTIAGRRQTGAELFEIFRNDLDRFIDHTLANFGPYQDADKAKWKSGALGSHLVFDIFLAMVPNQPRVARSAEVVLSEKAETRWRFSTGRSDFHTPHPVSGTREFGFVQRTDGHVVIYTRGADRISNRLDEQTEDLIFRGGEDIWERFQQRLYDFVVDHGSTATISSPIVNRPCWAELKQAHFKPRQHWSTETPMASPASELMKRLWKAQFKQAIAARPNMLVEEWLSSRNGSALNVTGLDLNADMVPGASPLASLVLELKRANPDLQNLAEGTGHDLSNMAGTQLDDLAEEIYNKAALSSTTLSPITHFITENSDVVLPISTPLSTLLKRQQGSPSLTSIANALPDDANAQVLKDSDRFNSFIRSALREPQTLAQEIDERVSAVQRAGAALTGFSSPAEFDSYARFTGVASNARDLFSVGETLIGAFDRDLAKQISVRADAVVKATATSIEIAKGVSSGINGLSSLASGNFVGAVTSLVSLFGGSQPDPAEQRHQEVMAALSAIKNQLKDIQLKLQVIDEKLDRLQRSVDQINFNMTQNFVVVLKDLEDLKASVFLSATEMHQQFLDVIENTYVTQINGCENQFKNHAADIVNDLSPAALAYRQCLSYPLTYALTTSRLATLTGALIRPDDPDFAAKLEAQPADNLIAFLFPYMREVIELWNSLPQHPHAEPAWADDVKDLPNPSAWSRGVKDYVRMRLWAPKYQDDNSGFAELRKAGEQLQVGLNRVYSDGWDQVIFAQYRGALVDAAYLTSQAIPAFRDYAATQGFYLKRELTRPNSISGPTNDIDPLDDDQRKIPDLATAALQLNIATEVVESKSLDGHFDYRRMGRPPTFTWDFTGCLVESRQVHFRNAPDKWIGPVLNKDCTIWPIRFDNDPVLNHTAFNTEDGLKNEILNRLFPLPAWAVEQREAPKASDVNQRALAAPFIKDGFGHLQQIFAVYLNDQLKAQKMPELGQALDRADKYYAGARLMLALGEGSCAYLEPVVRDFLFGNERPLSGRLVRAGFAAGQISPELIHVLHLTVDEEDALSRPTALPSSAKCRSLAESLNEGLSWLKGYAAIN